ncbi:MAG: hypothetical protein ACRDMW_02260 [Gaiellaceae bacterium]
MQIHLALQDGFDGDDVVLRVAGSEAYRGENVTTRTQISHAADMQLEVPEHPFTLEVDVPTRGVRESLQIDPHANANVTLSLRDGRVVAGFPEQIGFV